MPEVTEREAKLLAYIKYLISWINLMGAAINYYRQIPAWIDDNQEKMNLTKEAELAMIEDLNTNFNFGGRMITREEADEEYRKVQENAQTDSGI